MNDSLAEKSMAGDRGELSRKTGLIIRPLDSAALDTLFASPDLGALSSGTHDRTVVPLVMPAFCP
jgi:hypothetical protein